MNPKCNDRMTSYSSSSSAPSSSFTSKNTTDKAITSARRIFPERITSEGTNLAPRIEEGENDTSSSSNRCDQHPQDGGNRLSSMLTSWKNKSMVISDRSNITSTTTSTGRSSNLSSQSQCIHGDSVNGVCGDYSEAMIVDKSIESNSNVNPMVQYQDLVSSSPRKISFVILKTSNTSHKVDTEENEIMDTYSYEKQKSLGSILGILLQKNLKTKEFEIIDFNNCSNCNDSVRLLPLQFLIMLQPGDILESINGITCRKQADVAQLHNFIMQQQNQIHDLKMTFTFACKSAESQELHNQQLLPCIQQVIFITNNQHEFSLRTNLDAKDVTGPLLIGEESTRHDKGTSSLSSSLPLIPEQPTPQELLLTINAIQKTDPYTGDPILHLGAIESNNWLEDSCARSGDIVLSINSLPSFELSPEDANLTIQAMRQSHPYVSIKLYTRPLTRRESIRRVAVATAGGTMVGAGAVIMVTPLHPIGHAMAIGGLGVLGIEFDGPRKAIGKMTNVFRRQGEPSTNCV